MKKGWRIFLAAALALTLAALAACGTTTTPKTIVEAIEAKFAESGKTAVLEPVAYDKSAFLTVSGVSGDDVAAFYAEKSSVSGFNDQLIAIRAADTDAAQRVWDALVTYRENLLAQYKAYTTDGCYERVKASKLVQKNEYVFLL